MRRSSVTEPALWGKKLSYIISFIAPRRSQQSNGPRPTVERGLSKSAYIMKTTSKGTNQHADFALTCALIGSRFSIIYKVCKCRRRIL